MKKISLCLAKTEQPMEELDVASVASVLKTMKDYYAIRRKVGDI